MNSGRFTFLLFEFRTSALKTKKIKPSSCGSVLRSAPGAAENPGLVVHHPASFLVFDRAVYPDDAAAGLLGRHLVRVLVRVWAARVVAVTIVLRCSRRACGSSTTGTVVAAASGGSGGDGKREDPCCGPPHVECPPLSIKISENIGECVKIGRLRWP